MEPSWSRVQTRRPSANWLIEGIVLHELATQSASLEQAFMSATGDSEEFVAHEFIASVTAPADEDAPEVAQAPDDRVEVAGDRRAAL